MRRKEDDALSLSSEDEEKAPPPRLLALTLQGPGQKVKVRVAEVSSRPNISQIDISLDRLNPHNRKRISENR